MDSATISTAITGMKEAVTPVIGPITVGGLGLFAAFWAPKRAISFLKQMIGK